jgi:hypothetical protein
MEEDAVLSLEEASENTEVLPALDEALNQPVAASRTRCQRRGTPVNAA